MYHCAPGCQETDGAVPSSPSCSPVSGEKISVDRVPRDGANEGDRNPFTAEKVLDHAAVLKYQTSRCSRS